MSLIVLDSATADVARASRVYDSKPERHGAAFENEVERAIVKIADTPQLYPLAEDGIPGREFREYFIERFRQRVIYLITGDDIWIVAVVHADRREGAWHGNLP